MGEAFFATQGSSFLVNDVSDIADFISPDVIKQVDCIVNVERLLEDNMPYAHETHSFFGLYKPEMGRVSAIDEYFLGVYVRSDMDLLFSLDRPIASVELVAKGGIKPAGNKPSEFALVPASEHFPFVLNSQILAQYMAVFNVTDRNPSFMMCYENQYFFPVDMEKVAYETIIEERERQWRSDPNSTQLLGFAAPFNT